jgi:diacylglycerol O-acyltransferase / wax synthase
MKQLTGIDANFLYMETPSSFGHVNSLVVYERPDIDGFDPYEAFRSQLESRLHLLDPFRRRLVEVPLSLDHPYWINDPDFDLDFHVRHIALPRPGSLEQLSTQVARIIGRPIDRSRPLWEAYVFEGLENDDFAVLTKVHHATIDGASGVQMLGIILDSQPGGDEVPPDDGSWTADEVPSDTEMFARTAASFVRTPGKFARTQLRLMQDFAEITRSNGVSAMISSLREQFPTAAGRDRREGNLLARTGLTAPPTPFNKSITPHRRLALRATPLADLKVLKSALGATVNDVVMAISTGALRNYLLQHDALPDVPLRAMVPVSIRTGDEDDIWTNRVSGLVCDLPTHLADPLERVASVHESMVAAKEQFDMTPAETMVAAAQFAPPALAAQASRVSASLRLADRTNPAVNVVISNVPGPREPLYMSGARMKNFFPVSTIAPGVGLNITVQSYVDTLDFGLVACRELIPDLDDLLELHLAEIDTLFAAAGIDRDGSPLATAEPAASKKRSGTKRAAAKKKRSTS